MSEEGEEWKGDAWTADTCRCCYADDSSKTDPDIGPVCDDCHWRLKAARNDLYTISQQPL